MDARKTVLWLQAHAPKHEECKQCPLCCVTPVKRQLQKVVNHPAQLNGNPRHPQKRAAAKQFLQALPADVQQRLLQYSQTEPDSVEPLLDVALQDTTLHNSSKLQFAVTPLQKRSSYLYTVNVQAPVAHHTLLTLTFYTAICYATHHIVTLRVHTHTVQACKQLLNRFSRDNQRVLILSFSKHTLDTLQSYVQQWHYSCLRLDKQQTVAARYESIKQQQQQQQQLQQQQAVVYLANTAAASSSSGINMTGATRVIVYDVSCDPAVQEENALYTVFCNGQVSQCCVVGLAIA
eukprot:10316-Heterococcus_DN1.PRE.3